MYGARLVMSNQFDRRQIEKGLQGFKERVSMNRSETSYKGSSKSKTVDYVPQRFMKSSGESVK